VRLMYTSSTPTHANNDEQTRILLEVNTLFCRYF
jgi:hypothetical protein